MFFTSPCDTVKSVAVSSRKGLLFMKRKETLDRRPVIPGEAALGIALVINTLGVILMLYSGSGISAISSVPYAFSRVFPVFTLGTWTYLFQGVLVLSLMIMRRSFVPSYMFSFVIGFIFGKLLDIHCLWVNVLPDTLPWRISYFVISYILICIGIALCNRCGLPITPTDLFPRELTSITSFRYSRIKIGFDALCITATAAMTYFALGHISGLGIGTVLAALTMGKVIDIFGTQMDSRFTFRAYLPERAERLLKSAAR